MRTRNLGLGLLMVLLAAAGAQAAEMTFAATWDQSATGNYDAIVGGDKTANSQTGVSSATGLWGTSATNFPASNDLGYDAAQSGNINVTSGSTDEWTIEAWVKTTWSGSNGNGDRFIFHARDVNGAWNSNDISIYFPWNDPTKLYFVVYGNGGGGVKLMLDVSNKWAADTWHHVAFEFSELYNWSNWATMISICLDGTRYYCPSIPGTNGDVSGWASSGGPFDITSMDTTMYIGNYGGGAGVQGVMEDFVISDYLKYSGDSYTPPDGPPVPEPATLALLALGGAFGLLRRR